MQPLSSLSTISRIDDSYKVLVQKWGFYIEMTDDFKDYDFLQSLEDINDQNINCLHIFKNEDAAFAVALVLKIIIEQPIELFEQIEQYCCNLVTHEQQYALDLLKHIIYQLDKREPLTYLNQFLKNKNIPPFKPQDSEIKLSKIYSFVQLCDLGTLFKPFQKLFRIKVWKDNFSDEQYDFNFYQPNPTFPILILMKENMEQLQQRIYENHLIFIQNVGFQVMLDVMNQRLSKTTENLKFQPYRYENMEELANALCLGQSNKKDKVEKFKKIPKIKKLLKFLIYPGFSTQDCLQQIKNGIVIEKQMEDPFQEPLDLYMNPEGNWRSLQPDDRVWTHANGRYMTLLGHEFLT